MWVRSIIKSNGDYGRWEFGLFNLEDSQCTIPLRPITLVEGIQGWTDLQYGVPGEGMQVAVIPAGWAKGWMLGDKVRLVVHPNAQCITISCGTDGCPTPWPHMQGSIGLTATADRDAHVIA